MLIGFYLIAPRRSNWSLLNREEGQWDLHREEGPAAFYDDGTKEWYCCEYLVRVEEPKKC